MMTVQELPDAPSPGLQRVAGLGRYAPAEHVGARARSSRAVALGQRGQPGDDDGRRLAAYAPGAGGVARTHRTDACVRAGRRAAGRANLPDDASGEVVEIGAGGLVTPPPGRTGRRDIIEPVREAYAID
ncbi:hypothetical protein [Burkholderia arboris]|uniref:hypothetical protein n=1 Tax=Burkholderia arboris TaxID=488730 RepID=UPI0030F30B5C